MAPKTAKIAKDSWDGHKDTILSLWLTSDLTMDELVQAMIRDHGFSATASQFEAQLKIWKARKNLKSHEWEGILERIDSLASRGIQSRVVISGHPVSIDRVHRARRYCKHPKKRRRKESDLDDAINLHDASNVFIEIQDQDGNWSRDTVTGDTSAIPHQPQVDSGEVLGLDAEEPLVENHASDATQMHNVSSNYLDYEALDLSGIIDIPFQLPSLHTPDTISPNWLITNENGNIIEPMDLSFTGSEVQASQSFIQHESFTDIISPTVGLLNSPRLGSLARFPLEMMQPKDLPFERFEHETALSRLLAIPPSPMQDRHLSFGPQRSVSLFLHEAAVAMTSNNKRSPKENFYAAWTTLQTLHASFPRTRQEGGSTSITPAYQVTTDVELYRLLLYSTANGFIGMGDIPIGTVLRVFNQDGNITSLLSRLFRDRRDHVVKSLAENLFRAAIESGDHQTVRLLLQTDLVDVDNTFCFDEGEKYTPIQRAAELQGLKVIHELLRSRPNVNRTFLRPISYSLIVDCRSALGCLIQKNCPEQISKRNHSVFSPEYLEAVDALVEAGAEVHASFIEVAFKRFTRTELAKKLVANFAPSDHSKAFSRNIMGLIATEYSDEDANEAINKILSSCEQAGCKQCLSRNSDEVNWAIINGAKRGHIQLVRSLFQYAKSPTQILSAAIRGGNRELVEFVLAQIPDIRHAYAEEMARSRFFSESEFTTPLAEAIKARDSALIDILENRGALENLDHPSPPEHRFERSPFNCAIIGASRGGDAGYVRKLLSRCPITEFARFGGALANAIECHQEGVVHLLLNAGVGQAGWVTWDGGTGAYMWQACKWGNKSVLCALMLIFPDFRIDCNGSDIAHNMVDFSRQFGGATRDHLNEFLDVALKEKDNTMLCQCIEAGADVLRSPSMDLATDAALDGNLDMLHTLLKHIPPKACIKSFGTDAVVKAVSRSDMKVLEMLLNCGTIDIDSIGSVRRSPLAQAIIEDAASCCRNFPLTTKFLNRGCDVNGIVAIDEKEPVYSNITPLLAAIKAGSRDLVQFFIDHGADVNRDATYRIRQTPLQAAAEKGRFDIVELLLHNGADVNGKPAELSGGTALRYAAMSGNCNIAALLLDHGASLGAPESTYGGQSPLEAAVEHGRLDMIQFLWNKSVGGFPIEQCRKAMKLAEKKGNGACKDLIRELSVEFGIMPTVEGS
ncbi:ankyrin [Hypoxylon sp. FL1857]|nr:ankyrin [Hypoxylon sp. FL1857]